MTYSGKIYCKSQTPNHWVDLVNNKQSQTTSLHLHPCQYTGDLGFDDSEPESQVSDSSSTSQDSVSSPATSYSSEESRADQNQRTNEPIDESWPTVSVPNNIENPSGSRLTCEVPYRPKPDQNLHPGTSEYALGVTQESVSGDVVTPISQHPRRGRSTATTLIPALRRDTDPTDTIVRMIVLFCTNLINSIWCLQGQSMTDLTRAGNNVLPLEVFITETLRRSKTSYSTLQIALYYLILLKQCLPAQAGTDRSGCRAMQCGRRMFLTSLILASKYLQDRNYSARAWSKISGLPLKEINENERRFLSIVNWDLHVPKCTFENWSKIVLQVCRRSQEASTDCKDPEPLYRGPGSGPPGAQSCFVSNGNNRTWWYVNLRQLKTDVVKCGVKTQLYVESLCPFKPITPITRPISPESDTSEDSIDSFSDVLVRTPTVSRQSSLDRSSKRFEPVPDLLHPAAPLAMPPQPMPKNLPTPLTTPHSNVQNYWTPRLAHQSSSSSLRCRASASALGSAFRKHCPIANLETCPPPPPPPQHRACEKAQRAYVPVDAAYSSSASVVSSPESSVSDGFSVVGRSRSSSISSTASWATGSSSGSDPRWTFVSRSGALSTACPLAPPMYRPALQTEQTIERPTTAFKVSRATEPPSINNSRNKENIRDTKMAILAGCQVDESVVRSRARPALSRSGTQIYNPREEQDTKSRQLKRSRSDTFEYPSIPSCQSQTPSLTPPPDTIKDAWNPLAIMSGSNLRVQHPTEKWARPRKPLQTGPQNKRLALQLSPLVGVVG